MFTHPTRNDRSNEPNEQRHCHTIQKRKRSRGTERNASSTNHTMNTNERTNERTDVIIIVASVLDLVGNERTTKHKGRRKATTARKQLLRTTTEQRVSIKGFPSMYRYVCYNSYTIKKVMGKTRRRTGEKTLNHHRCQHMTRFLSTSHTGNKQ